MFRWLHNLFTTRNAIFKWKSDLREGIIKVPFRGSFCQYDARMEACGQVFRLLGESEDLLESVDFVGIEE